MMNQNVILTAFRSLCQWAMLILCFVGISHSVKAQGRDVTPNVVFSNYSFVNDLDQPIQGSKSGIANATISGYYKVDYNLSSLGGNIVNRDYFTYQIPDDFIPQTFTQSLKVNNIEVAVITVDTTARTVKITFNENASRMANYRGKLYIPVLYKPTTDGESQITYPDGTKSPVILWTTNPTPPNGTVQNERLNKLGRTYGQTELLWYLYINRSKQDFGDKEIIIKDRLLAYSGTGDEVVTYLLDSFTLNEATYHDPSNSNLSSIKHTIAREKIKITRDEEEYKTGLAAGQKIAFLRIISEEIDGYNNQGHVINMQRGFELYLGNSVGNKSYLLRYKTSNPETGARVMNSASLLVEGKETLPWDILDKKEPKSPGVVSIINTRKNNNTIEADLKDRLKITKYDKETGERLAGAVFNLQKADGTGSVYTLTSDADGFAQSEILDAGDYTLTEITAPSGYELSSTSIPITIVLNNPTRIAIGNYKVSNVPLRSFTVNKIWNRIDENIKKPTVNIILQKDGVDYLSAGRKQLLDGQTSVTWERLPATKTDGTKIKYTAREVEIEGFITTYNHTENSTTITNTLHIPAPPYCHRPANATGVGLDTNHGITLLNRAGDDGDGNPNNDWPMLRKGAWTALESNTKGLVFTRMTTTQINAISNPQEGMISYDTDEKCLKIYNGTKWSCFSTPSCPEN